MANVTYNKEKVRDFYTTVYDENERLNDRCISHRLVEKTVKKMVLSRFIRDGIRVCEIGAGTGVWVEWLLSQGCVVRAYDLVQKHVDIMNDKFGDNLNFMGAEICDIAEDVVPNEYFDVVLLSGPMYHVGNYQKRIEMLGKCNNILVKDGVLFVDWLSDLNAVAETILNPDCKNKVSISEDGYIIKAEDNIFSYSNVQEMKDMLAEAWFVYENSFPLDLISRFIKDKIVEFDEKHFNDWCRLVYQCRDRGCDISEHNITIATK